jgi:hypothetical protein
MMRFLSLIVFLMGQEVFADGSVRVFPGFVTKVQCEGKLLVSAVGNDLLVQLEALPKELGCGVILKPTGRATGKTNLLLETSTGTIDQELEVTEGVPSRAQRVIRLKAGGGA